ncbi:hypothetical protein KQI89_14775 [Clostridium sp. MSJ-4]|uniref:Stage III sporulation protein AC n=1 Tax=Clostridium simiarum TaxID=2841506 RepID=A0ABS6F431_9CLOT|nr:hypothetical protein [Clostridium simiarum]MBU5593013.1 hypothetical protein [Clostridium simiarum]
MLFLVIVFCVLLIITEIITLYKTQKKQELKVYIILSIILLTVSFLEYLQLVPRHLIKAISKFFI